MRVKKIRHEQFTVQDDNHAPDSVYATFMPASFFLEFTGTNASDA